MTRGSVPEGLRVAADWSWRLLVVAAAVVAALLLLARLYLVVFPVIVALLLATLLDPVARWLRERGAKPAVSAFATVGGFLALLALVIAVLVPQIADQFGEMGEVVEEGFDDGVEWLDTTFGISRDQITDGLERGWEWVQENFQAIGTGVLVGVVALIEILIGLALALVLLFFFVKDGEKITDWIVARTPPGSREDVAAVGGRAWATLGGYFRGTAIISAVDAAGIGLGLIIIGVPLALPLIIITFFAGFFPIVGAFTAGLLAVLVALISLGFVEALLVLAVVVAVQQLESNVLEPVVLSKNIPLHPVVIIVVLTAGGVLAGIGGAFLAVPAAAVVSAVGNEMRVRREREAPAPAPEP